MELTCSLKFTLKASHKIATFKNFTILHINLSFKRDLKLSYTTALLHRNTGEQRNPVVIVIRVVIVQIRIIAVNIAHIIAIIRRRRSKPPLISQPQN